MIQKEVWKDVKDYEGYYQVSNLGRVKSLKRKTWNNNNNAFTLYKERVLSPCDNHKGYLHVGLSKKGKVKTRLVHQLVTESFLNHNRENSLGLVINHINFNSMDNRLSNLEIVTIRENSNKKHIKSKSKFVGVFWHKRNKKWATSIHYKGRAIHIGYFKDELDASKAYQNKLKSITK